MPTSTRSDLTFLVVLKKTTQENRFFLGLFLVALIIGGLGLCLLPQGDLLLYFSEHRTPFWDIFFKYGTKLGEEAAFIGFLFLFLFIKYRYALLIPLIGLLVTGISFISKSLFQHPRPLTYYKALGTFQDINLVEGVYVVKGLTSFPSGHTMAGFALFTFVACCSTAKRGLALVLFGAAMVVGISRIYLVQHFLKDVYLGSIMGVGIAIVVYSIQRLYPEKSVVRS